MDSASSNTGIVRIHDDHGATVGAGILVGPSRVVTCAHVLNAALGRVATDARPPELDLLFTVSLRIPRGWAPAKGRITQGGWVPLVDKRGDVAVLDLQQPIPRGPVPATLSVPLGGQDRPFRTQGFPPSVDEGIGAHGLIMANMFVGNEWIQLEAAGARGRRLTQGFSGAPVFDVRRQAVVGMVVAEDASEPSAGIGAMIPIDLVAEYWPPLNELLPSCAMLDPCYWDAKARGVEQSQRRGWYFTDREKVLGEIVDWLRLSRSDQNIWVVTARGHDRGGGPGSGKSAILARVVTLTDRKYRADMRTSGVDVPANDPLRDLPVGTIDIAIPARGLTSQRVLQEIAAPLWSSFYPHFAKVRGRDYVELVIDELLQRGRRYTIVIDSIDEASNPRELAIDLRRLAEETADVGIRLLLGSRPGPGGRLLSVYGEQAKVLDIDDEGYSHEADIASYVRKRLVSERVIDTSGAPPSDDDEFTRFVARAAQMIATRAHPNFLIAQLTSRSILKHTGGDADDPLRLGLPSDVTGAMQRYLASFGDAQDRITDLLRPLAFAQGNGLPAGGLWATLAMNLSWPKIGYGADDVVGVLDTAADFIAGSVAEDGRTYYRVYHQALADYLRTTVRDQVPNPASIVYESLLEMVPRRSDTRPDWVRCDHYIIHHLAEHAVEAGHLSTLVEDLEYLVYAAPTELFSAITRMRGSLPPPADVYQRAYSRFHGESAATRAAYLQLIARSTKDDHLAERFADSDASPPWNASWATPLADDSSFIVGRGHAPISAVAIVEDRDKLLVVSGDRSGAVQVWDTHTGNSVGSARLIHTDTIYGVAIAHTDEGIVGVSAGRDETIKVWPVRMDDQRARTIQPGIGWIHALAIVGLRGRQVIIAAGEDGRICVHDLASGKRACPPMSGHAGWVFTLAAAEIQGRVWVVSGGMDRTLRVWDLETGRQAGPALTGHTDSIYAVAIAELAGVPVALSAGDDLTLRAWDLSTGIPRGKPFAGHTDSIYALTTVHADGRTLVASAGDDQMVRLWDLESGGEAAAPLAGHSGSIYSLAFGPSRNPTLVSGGSDRTIRAWRPRLAQRRTNPSADAGSGSVGWVYCLSGVRHRRRELVLSAGEDRSIRIWDAESGQLTTTLEWTERSEMYAVATIATPRQTILAAGGRDGTIRRWDLRTHKELGHPIDCHSLPVRALTLVSLRQRLVGLSAGGDGTVRVWNPRSGTETHEPLTGHADTVYALKALMVNGRLLALSGGFDRTLRIWHVETGSSVDAPLVAHAGAVYALDAAVVNGAVLVVSGAADGKVIGWDISTRRHWEYHGMRHADAVRTVKIVEGSTGTLLMSGGDDGVVHTVRLDHPAGGSRLAIDIGSPITSIVAGPDDTVTVGHGTGLCRLRLSHHGMAQRLDAFWAQADEGQS